jgi:hypothetical protein
MTASKPGRDEKPSTVHVQDPDVLLRPIRLSEHEEDRVGKALVEG